jgi:tetratricopeptide (TPR) repeat protein
MTNRRPSLQDRIRHRQYSEFVGRDDHVTLFRRNLAVPIDERIYIFNVFGQGGIGKSTLLRRFRELAGAVNALTALTNDDQTDILTAMDQIAAELARQGHELRAFSERYRIYRQRRQELESEPDAPSGFSALFTRTFVKGGLALARTIPVGGGLVDLVDGDAVASKAGEWADYVARKLRNNTDEIRLIREPVEELTPLWLADLTKLAEKAPVILFFDTYERTSPFLDAWLRDLLGGSYGPLPDTTQLAIAGRDELDRNLWIEYESVVARLSLAPFTEEEARDFLTRKGITDQRVIEVILRLSGRLPLLVATLAAEHPDDPAKVGDPSGTAVERFLIWTEDPTLRRAAVDAALARWFNRDIIALLVEEKQVDQVFEWLRRMPFVEERSDGWVYHAIAREQMLRYKHRDSEASWAALHERLAEHYEQRADQMELKADERWSDQGWRTLRCEALYHQLCCSFHRYIPIALNEFIAALDGKSRAAVACAAAIEQAEDDSTISNPYYWGRRMRTGLDSYYAGKYDDLVDPLTSLLARPDLDPQRRAAALRWRGRIYRSTAHYEQALADFDASDKLQPNNALLLAHRGAAYHGLARYDEALVDLSRALELDPQDSWALIRRGATNRDLNRHEAALADFSRAIDINSQYSSAWALRGSIYCRFLFRYDAALADLSRAIELDSHYVWAIRERAGGYLALARYQEALADLSRAIELEPHYGPAIARRARTYYMVQRFDEALIDFTHAIELNPDSANSYALRGATYRAMHRYDDALADLICAIALEEHDWWYYERALIHQLMRNQSAATSDFDQAIEQAQLKYQHSPDDFQNAFNLALYLIASGAVVKGRDLYNDLTPKSSVHRVGIVVDDLDDYLHSFPDNADARAIRDDLQSHIDRSHAPEQ